MKSSLGLDLPRRFAHEHSDRVINSDIDVLRPMATALECALGADANVIAKDMANTFAGTALFEIERDEKTSLSVSNTVSRLVESATDDEADRVVRFGSVLLLGTLSLAYSPCDVSVNNGPRRQESYSSAARGAIGEIVTLQHTALARAFDQVCQNNIGYTVVDAEKLAPAFLELAEQTLPLPNTAHSADTEQVLAVETQNGLHLEHGAELQPEVADEIAKSISSLPWSETLIEGGSLEISSLTEHGKAIAYVVDATKVHRKIADIRKHASEIHAATVTKHTRLAARKALDINKCRTRIAQGVTLVPHSAHGTNERTIRIYISRVPVTTTEGIPVLALAGVSRTKERQGELLRILLDDSSISTHRVMR